MGDVLGRRIAAAIIDLAVLLVLLVIVAKTLGDESVRHRSVWVETRGAPRIVFLLLSFAYFFVTELVWAQTLGKRVMKLRVVHVDGSELSARGAVVRNLVRIVDWLPGLYIVGALAVFASGERRARLGDMVASTKVVDADAPSSPPPERRDRPDDDEVLAQVLR